MLLLAGCIEIFQQDLADDHANDVPSVAFINSEGEDQIVVSSAPSGTSWSMYNVTGSRAAWFRLNDGPPRQYAATRTTVVGSGPLAAGDKIDFCLSQPGSLEVRLIFTPQNTIVHEHSFESVATHEYCR